MTEKNLDKDKVNSLIINKGGRNKYPHANLMDGLFTEPYQWFSKNPYGTINIVHYQKVLCFQIYHYFHHPYLLI